MTRSSTHPNGLSLSINEACDRLYRRGIVKWRDREQGQTLCVCVWVEERECGGETEKWGGSRREVNDWQTQNVHWLFHVQGYWLCSFFLFPTFLPFSHFPPSPPTQCQLLLLVMGPTPQCYWCPWWAAWSSSSSSSALLSSAEGERHPFLSLLFLPSAFCLLFFPLRWGMSCLAPGELAVRRWTSFGKKTHTHSQTYTHTHREWARQLVQLTHVRWVMTRHTRDVIDSSRQLRRCNQRPLAARPLHPSIPHSLTHSLSLSLG